MINELLSKAVLAQPTNALEQNPVFMRPLNPSSDLASQIGPQSPHFFQALKLGMQWLAKPVKTWEEMFADFHKNSNKQ